MDVWLPVIVSAVINLVIGIYVYGRLTERVSGHAREILELKGKDEAQDRILSDHGERIARLEPPPTWRNTH